MLSSLIPALSRFAAIVLSVISGFLSMLGVPALPAQPARGENPYLANGQTMISAHRLGAGLAPENTLMALEKTVNTNDFTVDILEMDVQLTKDGELVLLHNTTFDETSNAVEAFGHPMVSPLMYNYKELHEKLNLGANWGEAYSSLRGADIPDNLRVTKLKDALQYAEAHSKPNKPWYYTIEIKFVPFNLSYQAVDKFVEIGKSLGILDRICFGSFYPDMTQYASRKYPELTRCADTAEALIFLNAFRNNDDLSALEPRYKILCLPNGYGIDSMFELANAKLVDYAHKYGIAVQYFTSEGQDVEVATQLAALGADAIICDDISMVYKKLHN
ncbi:MAG: hypothetical protein LBQ80_04435 [Clostridium sp.]|jgi:glycerophosphoryl diester phosphodiesterase|nr:hypothetical protein [Clostridium sp.]